MKILNMARYFRIPVFIAISTQLFPICFDLHSSVKEKKSFKKVDHISSAKFEFLKFVKKIITSLYSEFKKKIKLT